MARTLRSLVLRSGALPLLLLPLCASWHSAHLRTRVASEGTFAGALDDARPADAGRALARRRLAERARGTYIGEMLAERDSALARWPDRHDVPLAVWVQSASALPGWDAAFAAQVTDAIREWDGLRLPVRLVITGDSARADVHVTFIDHFPVPISGRTRWMRDDDWWITDADIVLALHHTGGIPLDADAMHAMALHEVGHLLGLDHTDDPASIMAARVRVRTLSVADRATVRLLYALPPGGVR